MHAILQLRTAMVLTPSHSHHCYCSRARLFFLLLRILVYAAIFAVLFFVWASVDIDPFFLAAVGVVLGQGYVLVGTVATILILVITYLLRFLHPERRGIRFGIARLG